MIKNKTDENQTILNADKKNTRDVKVELLRCMACFMVVLTHIKVVNIVNGEPLKTAVLVECFESVCVGIFFMVTGFFLYSGKRSAWQTIRHFLEKTLVPTLLAVLTTLVLEKWLMGEMGFFDTLKNVNIGYVLSSMIKGVFQMSSDYWGIPCGHLWYIAEYMKLILFVPALLILIRYAGQKVLFYLAALNFYYCIKTDVNLLIGTNAWFPQIEPFFRPSQALLVMGFLLYQNKEKLSSKKSAPLYLSAAYIVSMAVMFFAQIRQLKLAGEPIPPYFTTWLSGIGLISAVLLAALALSLPDDLRVLKWLKTPILWIGKRSFMIYLLHYMVIIKLETLGIAVRFRALTALNKGPLIYYALYGSLIFILTVLLVTAVEAVTTGIKKAGKKGRKNIKTA